MRRRDNASNNNNWIENYHSDGHYQEILNLSLSSCSTVDSVVVKRHTFSMNNLLNIANSFYNYLAQREKQFNDTAKQIKNSESLSQNKQSQAIQTLNKIKEQNTNDRQKFWNKINKETESCSTRQKDLYKIPILMKKMVYEFHQNQIIRQVIEYFNTQRRNMLLILQKKYLENFKEKIELPGQIIFYKDFSSISETSLSLQFKSQNKAEIQNPLSSQVPSFENCLLNEMTFKLKPEKNINSYQYEMKSGMQGQEAQHQFKKKVEPKITNSQRIQGREEQQQFKERVDPKTNSTKFQKSFFNQKKKGKKD